jgi:hypothetical protein
MSDIIEIQQAAVADHIADLAREAAALRAERARDDVRVHSAVRDEMSGEPVELAPRRVRLGRWLVSVGEAIAGPSRTEPAALEHRPNPCDDRPDGLQHAA